MSSTQPISLSTNQVSRLTGLTLRQLQWLDERAIVIPQREGHNRAYQHPEIVELRIMAALRRKGISLQCLRKRLLPQLRKNRRELAETHANELFVLTDGREILIVRGQTQVIRTISDSARAMAVVAVSEHLSYVM